MNMLLTKIEEGDIIIMEVSMMFTYIKLKNFMSFKDVMFDLRNGSKGAKKFVAIYGENGSGKSNFINSINLLRRSVDSFEMLINAEKIKEIVSKQELPKEILEMAIGETDILRFIDSCRMMGCDDETRIEYGFKIGEHEGYYILGFAEKFLYEKLYYFTGKQRGTLFEIKSENERIVPILSNKLFNNKKVEEEICNEIEKYWGKH